MSKCILSEIARNTFNNMNLKESNQSTLILQTLFHALNLTLNNKAKKAPKAFKGYKGVELIDKIMVYNNLGEMVHETSSCSSIEIKKKGIYLVKILNINNLTKKGIIACQINECNGLLICELIESNINGNTKNYNFNYI